MTLRPAEPRLRQQQTDRRRSPVLGVYGVWPYFASMAILLALASTPLLAPADVAPNPRGSRITTLDGLRGFLALAVFFYHAARYHEYLADGRFQDPQSHFYRVLGPVGVEAFFMITGYLFWSRLVAERGRPRWVQLYVGRVFRIAPLYLFAITVMMAIVFVRLGPHLNESALDFLTQVLRWVSFGIFSTGDFNGYPRTSILLVGVTWTLRFEWIFYFSLPLLALAARGTRLHLPFVAAALAISLAYGAMYPPSGAFPPLGILPALFLVGMTCGSLTRSGMAAKLADPVASVIVGLLMLGVFVAFDSTYTAGAAILLGLAFYLIASGCSFFGLLTTRAARRLGNASYGIYLLQGLVLTLAFSIAQARGIALASAIGHWSMVLSCAVVLVGISAAAHIGIERTGIALGRRLMTGRRSRVKQSAAALAQPGTGSCSRPPSGTRSTLVATDDPVEHGGRLCRHDRRPAAVR